MNAKQYNSKKYTPQKSSSTLTYVLGGVAVVVIAAVVIGLVVWNANRSKPTSEYGTTKNAAISLADNGVPLLGKPDAPITIDMYEDFICPYCGQLERTYGGELYKAVDDGKLAIRLHILNFLDPSSATGTYSSRAAAAALTIAKTGDAQLFSKFHAELFETGVQPAEGSKSDHTNAELAALAAKVGANSQVQQDITNGANVDAASATAKQSRDDIAAKLGSNWGTPLIRKGDTTVRTDSRTWVSDLIGSS